MWFGLWGVRRVARGPALLHGSGCKVPEVHMHSDTTLLPSPRSERGTVKSGTMWKAQGFSMGKAEGPSQEGTALA